MEDSLLRQSFRFRLALSNDILKSKITLVVKKLLEFSKKKIQYLIQIKLKSKNLYDINFQKSVLGS